VEIADELKSTMKFCHVSGPLKGACVWGQVGGYYSVDGYPLANGPRGGGRARLGLLQLGNVALKESPVLP
jgi:hypothetical protein